MTLERWSRIARGFAFGMGLMVLVGWTFHLTALTHILPTLVAMNPMTAIGFVLLSTAITLLERPPGDRSSARSVMGWTLAWAVAGVGVSRLVAYAFGWSRGIDTALFHDSLAGNVMAPNTAVDFVLSGSAVATLDVKIGRWRPTVILSVLTGVIALLALIGYVYNAAALFTVAQYIPMALHSAVSFMAIALAMLCVRPDREPLLSIMSDTSGGALARRLLPVAFGLPVLLGYVRLLGEQRGWWGGAIGASIFVVAEVLILTSLILWISRGIYRMELIRQKFDREMRVKNEELARLHDSEFKAHEALKQAQSVLVQTEKLAGLGQMVAGVAHEINNPLTFVNNNMAVLGRDVKALKQLIELYMQGRPLLAEQNSSLEKQILAFEEQMDFAYTAENLPELMNRTREGLGRIRRIVEDLRTFSHLDRSPVQPSDMNACIESTAHIIGVKARERKVDLSTKLTSLPLVTCDAAKINQVLMNLLDNAIDACSPGGHVTVQSAANGKDIEITVTDDGSGIPPEIQRKIFDPFFTTKPVGKGTGLGLSISYGIIRDHGGQIELESKPGEGTRFRIRIPVAGARA